MGTDYFRSLLVATFVLLAVLSASQRSFLHATTNDEEPKLSFVFFGDSGKGNSEQYSVSRGIKKFCEEEMCEFITLLGDNFYPSGVSSVHDSQWKTKWWDPYNTLGLIFYSALGNHDYQGNPQAQVEYGKRNSFWVMPSRYYRFQKADTEFFVLDTEAFDDKQAKWLDSSLSNSTQKVKIVYGHHPIYSYGMHGNTPSLIKNLLPLLKNRATVYLSGHEHDKQVLEAAGEPPMIVVGTAAEVRPVRKGSRTVFAASTLGFGHLSVSASEVRVRMVDTSANVEFDRSFPITARVE